MTCILIKSAIYHHAGKNIIHDELLKDSDILQRLSFGITYGWAYGQRLLCVMQELSLSIAHIKVLPKQKIVTETFEQSIVGDIAETLACKKICGEKSNADYMKQLVVISAYRGIMLMMVGKQILRQAKEES